MVIKIVSRFSLISAFCSLMFLYNFCSILCFAVEDYYGELTRPYFLFGKSYWMAFSSMVFHGLFALCFFRKPAEYALTRGIVQILNLSLIIVVGAHISLILGKYFEAYETKTDWWTFLINVLALALYITLVYLADKSENNRKYFYMAIGVFLSCYIVAFGLSQHYMPHSVIKTLRTDKETADAVRKAIDALKVSQDIPENMPPTVQINDKDGKRIVTYEFVTDFDNIRHTHKYTERIRQKFNISEKIMFRGDVVAQFTLKQGKHRMEIELKQKSDA